MTTSILIIDNDSETVKILSEFLQEEKFQLEVAVDGEIGLKKALNQSFSIILLELMLPKLNGLELLRQVRKHKNTRIIVLTNHHDPLSEIVALELGANEFLTKPFNPQALLLRIRALIQETHVTTTSRSQLQFSPLSIDCTTRTVSINEQPLELTNAEFNILETLAKSPGQAFSKEELTEFALGRQYTAYDRSIDVHVSNLRNKLGNNLNNEPWIKTIRGFGYLLNV